MRCLIVFIFVANITYSQGYLEYFTGNANDLDVLPSSGVCLMGGASENDEAMIWFLNRANGGDIVVLRASGSDGYNEYFYTQLGVNINSVRTFVISDLQGATQPYVLDKIEKAEAIWFAGGDQFNYVSFFKDNAMEQALNHFINVKGGVIGGTSAGMAILGSGYFSAENGTVTNAQALNNPYDSRMTLGYDDFLDIPFLENVLTDTHYDDPDRRARHSVFLARYATDNSSRAYGIACNEYTAVCIDSDGKAYVYGEYPTFPEYAFFLQTNCDNVYLPENCTAGNPVHWNRNAEALKVYKVPGIANGENYFDLSDWQTGSGGQWENWYIDNGVFNTTTTVNPNCSDALSVDEQKETVLNIYPNPFSNELSIEGFTYEMDLKLYDLTGKLIPLEFRQNKIDTAHLVQGIYLLTIYNGTRLETFKLVKH